MRRITITVEAEDLPNGDVRVKILDTNGQVLAMGTDSMQRSSLMIGWAALRCAEDVE